MRPRGVSGVVGLVLVVVMVVTPCPLRVRRRGLVA
ncbi:MULTISPECIES: archaellin/type IV pilin N-terminal domain-containing protein [unclassified Streptomyces]